MLGSPATILPDQPITFQLGAYAGAAAHVVRRGNYADWCFGQPATENP